MSPRQEQSTTFPKEKKMKKMTDEIRKIIKDERALEWEIISHYQYNNKEKEGRCDLFIQNINRYLEELGEPELSRRDLIDYFYEGR